MKKRTYIALLCLFCLFSLLSLSARAATGDELENAVSDFFDAVPKDVKDAYEEDRLSDMADGAQLLSFLYSPSLSEKGCTSIILKDTVISGWDS